MPTAELVYFKALIAVLFGTKAVAAPPVIALAVSIAIDPGLEFAATPMAFIAFVASVPFGIAERVVAVIGVGAAGRDTGVEETGLAIVIAAEVGGD